MVPAALLVTVFSPPSCWAKAAMSCRPIEPGGTLPSGQSFQTPLELVALLKQREEDFRRCLSEKMVTFALGRGLDSADRQYIAEIAKGTLSHGDTLSALICEIVKSEPFRQRRTAKGGS